MDFFKCCFDCDGGIMTQREQLLNLFQANGNRLTLGQILNTTLAAEYRARITELRHEGYIITLERGKTSSENVYRLFKIEANGQLRLA